MGYKLVNLTTPYLFGHVKDVKVCHVQLRHVEQVERVHDVRRRVLDLAQVRLDLAGHVEDVQVGEDRRVVWILLDPLRHVEDVER